MFWKLCATFLCVATAVALFDWTGRFHVVVGLPMLTLVAVIGWKLRRRNDDDIDDLQNGDDETPGVSHRVFMGGVQGVIIVGILALAFVGFSSTPLRALIEGPDCQVILGQIDILATGQAQTRIVQVVETSLKRPLGPVCRQALLDRQVRALLVLAEAAPETERLELLEQAQGVAVEDVDLNQLVYSRLEAEQVRLKAEQKEKDDAAKIAKILEEKRELGKINEEIKAENAKLAQLAEAFKAHGLTVEERPEGINVILSEKDALRFAPSQADLDDEGRATVGRIAKLLSQPPYHDKRVLVIGHTDATGSNHEKLSMARADSVAQELLRHGVREERLEIRGVGKDQPVGDNATDEGRAKNRRVEISIYRR